MSTGTRSLHQNERVVTEAVFPLVLNSNSAALSAANQTYIVCPVKGYVSEVYTAVVTALTTAKSTQVVKTAAGTVATFEIAHEAAVGTVDQASAQVTLANTLVEAGATIEIEHDDAPGAGACVYTVVISESA